ncbi:hypothetical protein OK006_10139 [Actinobacteria bacterium OK006]|nr:hypothetical protein OK006_10139 [Actinobacteria bacterium OK006]
MRDGQVRVFVALGGNFVAAAPDTDLTEQALKRCRLTVQISTKLNRSHVIAGEQALILPCLGRTEADLRPAGPQSVTVEDSMSKVHLSRGRLKPASEHLLSEVTIICRRARAALGEAGSQVPWENFESDYDRIRDRIERVIPGFEDFNARVRQPGGFALPHPPCDERRFTTSTGLANFTANPLESPHVPEGRLLLQTLRSHDRTTPPSTAWTIVTAASTRGAASSSCIPTTSATEAWPTGTSSTS